MWKGIEHLKTKGELATDKEEEIWEAEYRNMTRGSFEKSTDLVSELLAGCGFDEFVAAFLAKNGADAFTKAGFPSGEGSLKLNHIYMELFRRRNRIMHWGQVDYRETDSRAALKAGRTAFAILKLMDKERYEAMEKAWRASLQ